MWKAVNESISVLCNSTFWDTDLTWNSSAPEFTPCFRKTILVWLPCVLLWLFLPLEIYLLRSSKARRVPFSFYNVFKLFFIFILIASSAIDIVDFIYLHNTRALVELYSPIIKTVTFVLFFVLTLANIKCGVQSSGALFIFSLFLAFCGISQFLIDLQFKDYVLESMKKLRHIFADSGRTREFFEKASPLTSYLSILIIFFLNCFADGAPAPSDSSNKENVCPEKNSSFLCQSLLGWFDAFVWKGYRKPITVNELWDLENKMKSSHLADRFESIWLAANKSNKSTNTDVIMLHQLSKSSSKSSGVNKGKSILRPLWDTFGSHVMMGISCKMVYSILLFVNTAVLGLLIGFAAGEDEFAWHGYLFAFLLWLICSLHTIFYVQHWRIMNRGGLQIRAALVSVIYKKCMSGPRTAMERSVHHDPTIYWSSYTTGVYTASASLKSLRISSAARTDFTLGEVVNLMAVDAQRFLDFMEQAASLLTIPLEIILAIFFLWKTLGPSAMIGVALLVIITPINAWIASKVKSLQMKQMYQKDERIKLISEMISGIKVLKMYAWEPSFEKEITRIRKKEIETLKHAAYYHAPTTLVWTCAPFLLSLITFAVYVLSDSKNVLTAETAFVTLSLFDVLKTPLSDIPPLMKFTVQAFVSLKRISKFLNAEELDPEAVLHEQRPEALIIENGQFSWESLDGLPALCDINLKVKPGSLVAVVGPVGSGKSSLVAALLGEMYKQCGFVNTTGRLAYVPQEAWIRNVTFKENITFGEAEDSLFYRTVLDACALIPDLAILPAGDQTEIGEKGVNLSGGQKQRISIARAVYSGADTYILDDPLSAVDSHVGRQIFERVIGPNGLLRQKTRIFVTHSVAFLPQVDHIIVLRDGMISESGTYDELLKKKGDFADFLLTYLKDDVKAINEDEEVPRNKDANVRKRRSSGFKESTTENGNEIIGQKLVEDEGVDMGEIKLKVYLYFVKALSPFLVFVAILMNVVFQALSALCGFWLSIWTSDPTVTENGPDSLDRQYLYVGVLAFFVFLQAVTMLTRTVALDVGILRATNRIHNSLLNATLHWSVSSFDKIPVGRIINRFGFDIDVLDNMMPENLKKSLMRFTLIISIFVVISLTTPLFVTVIVPLGIIYFFLQRFYAATLRELKRLEAVSRSPIYSHFSETLTGTHCIRASNLQSKFINMSQSKLDLNQRSLFAFYMSERWLDMRLELMGGFITFSSAIFAILDRDSLSAGLVGLSISYALQLTNTLGQLVQTISETEMNIVAVERIREYTTVEKEAPWELTEDENVPENWPNKGEIVFKDFQVRYREELDPVLKGISFNVKSCEKIGVVGRTGAGKSSLTLSMFRIIESAGGQITIDDIDISKIGLHTLRSRLTIIPQDPVLFTGTLRMNLDPMEKHSDESIWKALELAYLKPYVSTLCNGLHYKVTEGGRNFSVGQRQLICLTRALLRRTKVLLLDEATAAIDLETDDLIQKTIRKEFKECTVLTIAHRLNTILDYDKIIVLDKGHIVEYDSPDVLLKSKQSAFYKMASNIGLS